GCLPAAVVILLAPPAAAHPIGFSRGEYRAEPGGLAVDLVFSGTEIASALEDVDRDHNGSLDREELVLARSEIEKTIVGHLAVSRSSRRCEGKLAAASLGENDAVKVSAHYDCNADPGDLTVSLGFLDDLPEGHRHAAHIVVGASVRDVLYFGSHQA